MIVHDYRVKFTDVAISPPNVAKISASAARGFFWSPGTWRPRGYSAIVDQHHIGALCGILAPGRANIATPFSGE
jgi:hypothetical protein